jgi:2-oxoglutarate ferredoxin oxidoreductase subunit alpha
MVKKKFIQGNVACVEAAIAAGMRFYAGYPITPSTEIAEMCAEELPKLGGKFIQMEDEIASMGAVIGASFAGKQAMTATSGPGFSLKQENLGYAAFVEAPCVVVNIMRSGPSTGLPTSPAQQDVMQTRWGSHGDHPVIVLCPDSVRSMYDLTYRAFELAERYRVPVILAADEVIAHMRERIDVDDDVKPVVRNYTKKKPGEFRPYDESEGLVPAMAKYGDGYRFNTTGLMHGQDGFPITDPAGSQKLQDRLRDKIEKNSDDIIRVKDYNMSDAETAVFAYGSTARSAMNAVLEARMNGIKAGLIVPETLWPFPDKILRENYPKVKTFIVAEMNMGQLVHEVERVVCGSAKVLSVLQANGEIIKPDAILKRIMEAAK